jgi:hypothetical protein
MLAKAHHASSFISDRGIWAASGAGAFSAGIGALAEACCGDEKGGVLIRVLLVSLLANVPGVRAKIGG